MTKLLGAIPDRDRAGALAPLAAGAITTASFVTYDANSDNHGVTPLDLAPTPTSLLPPWSLDDTTVLVAKSVVAMFRPG